MIEPFDAVDGHRFRVGCDVVEVRQVVESVSRFGDRYLRKVFTEGEVADCGGRPDRLSARFAAKEAVIKAFAAPDESFALPEIEVVRVGSLPALRLAGRAAAIADQQGWVQTSLSLSHAECHAMAVVMALCSR